MFSDFRVDMGADVSLLVYETTWNRIGRPKLTKERERAIKKCFRWNYDFQRHDKDQGLLLQQSCSNSISCETRPEFQYLGHGLSKKGRSSL